MLTPVEEASVLHLFDASSGHASVGCSCGCPVANTQYTFLAHAPVQAALEQDIIEGSQMLLSR